MGAGFGGGEGAALGATVSPVPAGRETPKNPVPVAGLAGTGAGLAGAATGVLAVNQKNISRLAAELEGKNK